MGDRQDIPAEDLALLGDDEGDGGADSGQAKEAPAKPQAEATAKTDPAEGKEKADPKTIAAGADAEDKAKDEAPKTKAAVAELTDDLRKLIAEHASAGDKKAYQKELRRLERIRDIPAIYGMYRDLEAKFTSGGLVKLPGKDAKPEEIAEFNKAMGVPEKPEDYFKDIKLENGAVLGDADKPLADSFAAALHPAGATPAVVSAALNWYFKNQEEQAAALDDADDSFRRESEQALKEEFGPAFKRNTKAIKTLFATAPGGADADNEGSLFARLMGGRTADGRIIGNDPDMVRFLVGLVQEIKPAETVVEDGAGIGSIDQQLAEIAALRKTDKRKYYSEPIQKREAELIAAREKLQARAA